MTELLESRVLADRAKVIVEPAVYKTVTVDESLDLVKIARKWATKAGSCLEDLKAISVSSVRLLHLPEELLRDRNGFQLTSWDLPASVAIVREALLELRNEAAFGLALAVHWPRDHRAWIEGMILKKPPYLADPLSGWPIPGIVATISDYVDADDKAGIKAEIVRRANLSNYIHEQPLIGTDDIYAMVKIDPLKPRGFGELLKRPNQLVLGVWEKGASQSAILVQNS